MHLQIPYVISGLQHLTALSKYDSNIVLDTQDKDNNQTDKVTDKIIDFQSVKPTILSPHQTSELINVFAITLCGSRVTPTVCFLCYKPKVLIFTMKTNLLPVDVSTINPSALIAAIYGIRCS